MKYAFGIDIGGTTVKIGLFDIDGRLLEQWEIPTRTEANGKNILPDIAWAVQKEMREKKIDMSETAGIGLGVPGPVGEDGTVFKCVNLGWDVMNVERELASLTGLKVRAGNDANVAALGEMWQGGGKGHKNLVMVTLGTGVGGGVIIDGKILPGADGAGGEIGHLKMRDDETEACNCGNYGCLEQYASATGIVRLTQRHSRDGEDSILWEKESLTAKDIFEAAKAGDRFSQKMVAEVADTLGRALAQIACVLNPEIFVIGGGMANAGDYLIDSIREAYQKYAFHAAKKTEFKKAELGNRAGMYGGVQMILE